LTTLWVIVKVDKV